MEKVYYGTRTLRYRYNDEMRPIGIDVLINDTYNIKELTTLIEALTHARDTILIAFKKEIGL